MPTNDYITYMKEDIMKCLEKEEQKEIKVPTPIKAIKTTKD
jgi:hypothetical protein